MHALRCMQNTADLYTHRTLQHVQHIHHQLNVAVSNGYMHVTDSYCYIPQTSMALQCRNAFLACICQNSSESAEPIVGKTLSPARNRSPMKWQRTQSSTSCFQSIVPCVSWVETQTTQPLAVLD